MRRCLSALLHGTQLQGGQREPNSASGRDSGVAMVEMAIILPLLIILVFGLITASRAYNAKLTLTHATREGVRELAIHGDEEAAVAVTRAAATSLDPNRLSVETTECVTGDPTEVTGRYQFQWSIPLVGEHLIWITSTAVMRCGG